MAVPVALTPHEDLKSEPFPPLRLGLLPLRGEVLRTGDSGSPSNAELNTYAMLDYYAMHFALCALRSLIQADPHSSPGPQGLPGHPCFLLPAHGQHFARPIPLSCH
jgi:hypothetical protein